MFHHVGEYLVTASWTALPRMAAWAHARGVKLGREAWQVESDYLLSQLCRMEPAHRGLLWFPIEPDPALPLLSAALFAQVTT